jgi:hypothetical protein
MAEHSGDEKQNEIFMGNPDYKCFTDRLSAKLATSSRQL